MEKIFSVGIDLGTSNSALAYTRPEQESPAVMPVTQCAGPGRLAEQPLLPSALYIAAENEFPAGALDLPWTSGGQEKNVLGQFAREYGSLNPERLVTSAKSWLCNSQIDRREPILPWKAAIEQKLLSPVEVSAAVLRHLKENLRLHAGPEAAEQSQIVLTVPASFDEVARNLTYESAEQAGWGRVTLLEEPQAAFYSWISASGDRWRSQIAPGDIVLVCDIGGGTTDFSMIAVSEENGELRLHRISVGEHILLGGDNMDLALAFAVKARLESGGKKLGKWPFLALVHLCRQAKERLLSGENLEEFPVSIAGRGGSLLRDTITASIPRSMAEEIVLSGFFPQSAVNDLPEERRTMGLQEFGLPYAADPAVTRHLARFLSDSMRNVRSDPALQSALGSAADLSADFLAPTAVLFNGGVFKSAIIRRRVLEILGAWCSSPVKELLGGDPDLAVARGACSYGELLLSGKGLRIKAGTARSYYIGLETSMPAVPGYKPPVKGLCVVPQGSEEGTTSALLGTEFGLVTGETVEFRFFGSNTRAGDEVGAVIEDAEEELEETARLSVCLPAEGGRPGEVVPVRLESRVTEFGTLELWMVHMKSDARWKLDFNLRTGH